MLTRQEPGLFYDPFRENNSVVAKNIKSNHFYNDCIIMIIYDQNWQYYQQGNLQGNNGILHSLINYEKSLQSDPLNFSAFEQIN